MELAQDPSFLYDCVTNAASRGAITELLYLWAPTPWLGMQGVTIRTAINSIIPSLVNHFGITLTEEIEFPEFVKLYDEHVYCQAPCLNPDECIVYFAKQGNERGVQTAINKGAYKHLGLNAAAECGYFGLVKVFIEEKRARPTICTGYGAAYSGRRDILDYIAKNYFASFGRTDSESRANFWRTALGGAAYNNNTDLIQYILKNKPNDFMYGIQGAIKGGHKDLVEYFVELSFQPGSRFIGHELFVWQQGLETAAFAGKTDFMEYFFNKGAKKLTEAMNQAICGGSIEAVSFLLDKGLNASNGYLTAAASTGNIELIKLFISSGASDLNGALTAAIQNGQLEAVKFLVENKDVDLMQCMILALEARNEELIQYFKDKGVECTFSMRKKYGLKLVAF